jgi:hypothetical protein
LLLATFSHIYTDNLFELISFESFVVKYCPSNIMAVAIDIYNVDYDVNFFQSLKLAVRNKTLERFLENSDIQDLAFAAAQLDGGLLCT